MESNAQPFFYQSSCSYEAPPGTSSPASGSSSTLLPLLTRLHVLPLNFQAAHLIYPSLFPDQHDASDHDERAPAPMAIVHHFVKLLKSATSSQYPVHLFQTFHVDSYVYVIVDIEGVHPRTRGIEKGLLTTATSIFTTGAPIKPLTSLQLSLIRPFGSPTTPTTKTTTRSKSSRSWLHNIDLTSKNENNSRSQSPHSCRSTSPKPPLLSSRGSLDTNTEPDSAIQVPPSLCSDTNSNASCAAPRMQNVMQSDVNVPTSSHQKNPFTKTDTVTSSTSAPSRFVSISRDATTPQQPLDPASVYPTATTSLRSTFLQSDPACQSKAATAIRPHTAHTFLSSCFNSNPRGKQQESLGLSSSTTQAYPITVELRSFLCAALQAVPSIIFIRGRELALSFSGTPGPVGSLYKLARRRALQSQNSHLSSCSIDSVDSNGVQKNLIPETSLISPALSHLRFFVTSTGDQPLGVAVPGFTKVDIQLDHVGEFDRIHISPIADTIPAAYEFDFFNSYVRPFLDASPGRLFYEGDIFTYHGVQFKVQRTQPGRLADITIPDSDTIFWRPFSGILPKQTTPEDNPVVTRLTEGTSSALMQQWEESRQRFCRRCVVRRNGALCCRIGQETRIHQGEPTPLHWVDLLPPNVLEQIRGMPSRLQPFALMHAISDLAPHDLLRILGWSSERDGGDEQSDALVQQEMRNRLSVKIVEEYATTYTGEPTKPLNASLKRQTSGTSQPTSSSHTAPPVTATDESDWTCVVCLETIVVGDRVLVLPCTHVFHLKCVVEWLKRSILCPVCKRDLRDFL